MSEDPQEKSFACTLSDCDAAASATWQEIQQAAEDAYDRTAQCRFTSFVGYEYTESPQSYNLHRNVIFRNEHVPPVAISSYETGSESFPVCGNACARNASKASPAATCSRSRTTRISRAASCFAIPPRARKAASAPSSSPSSS
jgi:hypothetical protein